MEKEIVLEEGRTYSICTCGASKNLPFCDAAHKALNEREGTCYKSLKIVAQEKARVKVMSANWENDAIAKTGNKTI